MIKSLVPASDSWVIRQSFTPSKETDEKYETPPYILRIIKLILRRVLTEINSITETSYN